MSDAPSISTPFLPPSLMILALRFSASLAALAASSAGFSSFFGWTLYTESDLLKSDRELLSKAEQREQRAKR